MFDVARYERVLVDRYRFHGVRGCESWCALEILRGKEGQTVVIATEVKDDPGTSITNACEHLAHWVCVEFSIDPARLVWIEHYGYPAPAGLAQHAQTYDLVTFEILPPGHDAVFAGPKWRPMSEGDWSALGLAPRQPGP